MDDETRVVTEQLKRRTANLIHETHVLREELAPLKEQASVTRECFDQISRNTSIQDAAFGVLEKRLKAMEELYDAIKTEQLRLNQLYTDLVSLHKTIADLREETMDRLKTMEYAIVNAHRKAEQDDMTYAKIASDALEEALANLKIPEPIDLLGLLCKIDLGDQAQDRQCKTALQQVDALAGRVLALEAKQQHMAMQARRQELGR